MGEFLNIQGPARIAAGSFLAGAGVVGIAWALTTRTPAPPPPNPEPILLWPGEKAFQTSDSPEASQDSSQGSPNLPTDTEFDQPEPLNVALNSDLAKPQEVDEPSPVEVAPDPDSLKGSPLPESPIDGGPNSEDPDQAQPDEAIETESLPRVDDRPASAVRLISMNSAGTAELQLLPGIGPVLAQRIVDDRAANGRFGSLNDLQRVKGIGVKTAEKLAPLITFE